MFPVKCEMGIFYHLGCILVPQPYENVGYIEIYPTMYFANRKITLHFSIVAVLGHRYGEI